MGNVTNGSPNHRWYDHIDIMKDVELYDVIYRDKYNVIRKWAEEVLG